MNLGNLKIIIGGDSKDLDRALAGADARIASFSRRLTTLVAGLGLAAAVAGLLHFEKKTFETIDAQSELAYRVGASISAIQVLTAVGDKAGVSQEALAKALGLMNMRLAEAARTASGPAHEALRRIGLSANDLLKLNADERMAVLADRFQKLGLTAAQQAEVLRNFGIRQQEVINLLEGGGDAIRKARKDLEGYGVALSTIDAQSVEAANDAFKDAKLAIQGVANQIAVALAPIIGTLASDFAEAGKATGGFRDAIQSLAATAVSVFGAMSNEWHRTRVEFDEMISDAIDGINFLIRGWNRFANDVPGMSRFATTEIANDWGKLRKQIGDPPTGEDWDKWFEELKRKWNEAAQTAADAQDKMRGRKGRDQDNLSEDARRAMDQRFQALQRSLANEAAALDFWRKEELLKLKEFEDKRIATAAERNAARLAIEEKYQRDRAELIFTKLQQEVGTESENLAHRHALQLRAIGDFENARTITETQAAELRRKYAEKQALDIIQLHAKQYAGLANIVDTAMGHISQIIGKEGGAAFEIMKAISMATATVKGIEAVVSAMAFGNSVGGPVVGAAMGAVAAAGVGAQIAAIARTKPSGAGGTVTAPAAVAGAPAAAAAAAGPVGGTLVVQGINPGSLFSGEVVRGLVEQLHEYQRNGGKVVLA